MRQAKTRSHSLQNLGCVDINPETIFSCTQVLSPLSFLVPECVGPQCKRYASGNTLQGPQVCQPERGFQPRFVCVPCILPYHHRRIAHSEYAPKRESSCGDPHKPLVKYDPNAQRNRLKQPKFSPANRNCSDVHFGEKYPRQFVTTNKAMFRGETGIMSSNRSIVASKVKFYHALQAR